jgi:flavin-dependent dehydrogenase
MPKLTAEQQKFLDDTLKARPIEKGKLGGRQLSKVKEQYADFLRRRRKCDEALRELESTFGPESGARYDKLLRQIAQRVDKASDAGDETIFATAYDELEAIKKGIRDTLESLKTERQQTSEASVKVDAVMEKLRAQKDPAKRTALARQVGETCEQWLRKHPGVVAPKMTEAYFEALTEAGAVDRKDLNLLAENLANQSYAVCREVEKVLASDGYAAADTRNDYTGRMARLELQLRRTLKAAQDGSFNVAAAQLQRTLAELHATQWRAVPPTLDDMEGETAEEGSATDDDAGQQAARVLDKPVETLTNAQVAYRTLVKSTEIAQHLESEILRVQGNLADIGGRATKSRTDNASRDALLGEDLALLGHLVTDATAALASARLRLAAAKTCLAEVDKHKALPGLWELHQKDAALACDTGLGCIASAERLLGEVEGGIILVERAVQSLDSFKDRVTAVDESDLGAVESNLKAAMACKAGWAKDDNLMLLQHLVFTSADAAEAQRVAAAATDQRAFDAAVKKLIAAPKLGTAKVTMLLAQCQRLSMDAERFYGTSGNAKRSLPDDLKPKFQRIFDLAKDEAAKFTVPVLLRPQGAAATAQLQSVGVAVVGGGPIGLLAAVEARMAGASEVHVYEGRSDPYSRMNVIKIDDPPAHRLIAAGVGEEVFPEGYAKSNVASVKTIENALLARCNALGVKMERDKYLVNVTRDTGGRTQLFFKGDPVAKGCDLLILATGGSIASAQKYADNVVLADVLGIPVQKSAAKDYAAVGLFGKGANTPKADEQRKAVDGWAYDFETAEVKYLVTQLTEEEFRAYSDEPRLLIERLQKDARAVKLVSEQPIKPQRTDPAFRTKTLETKDLAAAIDAAWDKIIDDMQGLDNFFRNDKKSDQEAIADAKEGTKKILTATIKQRTEKKSKEMSADGGFAPEAVQKAVAQAGMLSPEEVEKALMNALLPRLGASRFPIEVQQAHGVVGAKGGAVLIGDSAATPHPSTAKGLNTGIAEMGAVRDLVQDLMKGTGTEKDRQEATQVYAFEVKRRTDFMVDEALETMQSGARARITKVWNLECAPPLKAVLTDQQLKDLGTQRDTKTQALSVARADAAKDRDWKRREAAVKNLRKLETDLRHARQTVDDLISAGKPDPLTVMAQYQPLLS